MHQLFPGFDRNILNFLFDFFVAGICQLRDSSDEEQRSRK
jgi:hypothetical protein